MTPLYIHAFGAVTSIGLSAERSVASLRSGLDGFMLTPFWGEAQQDLQIAPVQGFAEGLYGVAHYEALAMRALIPTLEDLSAAQRANAFLLLGLPRPTRPGVPEQLAKQLAPRLAERLHLAPTQVRSYESGRASTYLALAEARELCTRGRECVIGGVDCLTNPHSLRGLSKAHLLKEAWDGFIPGDAAAFLRLSTRATRGPWGRPAARVVGLGSALETADGTAQKPLVGAAVRKAFQAATSDAAISDAQIDLCVNDVNGARAAFEDDAMGWVRFFRSQRETDFLEVWHTASYVGEIGAASGALALIWAASALELGFHPARYVLLSAADAQARTAVVLAQGTHRPAPDARARFASFCIASVAPVLHPQEPEPRAQYLEPVGLPVAGADARHRQLLEQNLEAVAGLSAIIKAHHELGDEPWLDIEGFEDRLLANVDALAWAGGEAREVALSALSSEEPDQAAAAALTLLSFPVDDALFEPVIRAASSSDEHALWICETLRYAPSVSAEPMLARFLREPSLAASALDALRASGALRFAHVESALAHQSPALLAAAIRALGWLCDPSHVHTVLDLLRASEAPVDEETLIAALAISQRARDVFAAARVTRFADAPLAWVFARFRHATADAVPFAEAEAFREPAALTALGFSGDQKALPILLAALGSGDPALAAAAAHALFMIYDKRPQTEVTRRDDDDERPSTLIKTELASSPEVWLSLLPKAEHAPLRLGAALASDAALRTLRHPSLGERTRRLAVWEQVLWTREKPLLHARQFVRLQRRLLFSASA